jgi:iron complex outermembrane receptor protein
MPRINRILLPFIFLLSVHASGQLSTIRGRITDSTTHEPIRYASVTLDTSQYTMTGEDGTFSFSSGKGDHIIQISCIGYRNFVQSFSTSGDHVLDVELSGRQSQLNQVVVSSSRQQRQLAREPVSLTVIQPYLITNTNSRDLSDVLNRVPGVSVVDGQATMRAGVGYSYNVGSRVTVLLDDMPLMGPDVGDVNWKLLPIEAAEQIEVTQGASSSLYGSSAMNGTINVRTGWPGGKPETKISIYEGVYDNPRRKQAIWWERTSQPMFAGASFVHRQAFGKFDLVWSGNVMGDHNYIQQNDEFRARTYIKTRYRFEKVKGLSAGINLNSMLQKAGRFFLWGSADTFMLQPFNGSVGLDFYNIYSIDPHVTWEVNSKLSMSLKTRYYNITRYVDPVAFPNQNDAVARIYALDYNVQNTFLKRFHATSGMYLTRMTAVGNVYPGNYTGYSAAAYTQLSFERKRWTVVGGLRYEVNALGPIQSTADPLKRLGINYQAGKQTFFRAAYGEGYRFPTVAERYVNDRVGQPPVAIVIAPNPNLRIETGWTGEVGVKQGFSIYHFVGYADVCAFVSDFNDLIDFRLQQIVQSGYDPVTQQVTQGVIGFRANNYGHTRNAGFEISVSGEGKVGHEVRVRTLSGFTYAYPVSMDTINKYNLNYLQGFSNSFTKIEPGEKQALLPYRNRVVGKVDIEMTWKKLTLGYGMFYYSRFDRVDDFMHFLFPDLKAFMEKDGPGDWVHNVRISYMVTNNLRLAILVNNFTNHEYAIRPLKIDPPRNFTLQANYYF